MQCLFCFLFLFYIFFNFSNVPVSFIYLFYFHGQWDLLRNKQNNKSESFKKFMHSTFTTSITTQSQLNFVLGEEFQAINHTPQKVSKITLLCKWLKCNKVEQSLINSRVKSQKLKVQDNFILLFISIRGKQNEIGGMLSKIKFSKKKKKKKFILI